MITSECVCLYVSWIAGVDVTETQHAEVKYNVCATLDNDSFACHATMQC